MLQQRTWFWRGIRPLFGTVIGVGFFSLPFLFGKTGYFLVLVELAVMTVVQIVFLRMYADLTLLKKSHARFLRIIGDAFGPFGKGVALVSFFGTLWGAMIAYILTGGTFLSYLTPTVLGIHQHTLALLFGLLCTLALGGGAGVMRSIQKYCMPLFVVLLVVLCVTAFPYIRWEHLQIVHGASWAFPLGVLLFSLSGLSAVPEMRDALLGNASQLRIVLGVGMALVACVYAVFAFVVVGIAGVHTPPEAIAVFAWVAPWLVLLGSLFGVVTMLTVYVHVGSALVHTLVYDFRMRYFHAWGIIAGVPLVAIALGVHDVIEILHHVGGVLGAVLALVVLLAYEKARAVGAWTFAHAHGRATSFGLFVLFFVLLVVTLLGT